jgi:hypothetical protein
VAGERQLNELGEKKSLIWFDLGVCDRVTVLLYVVTHPEKASAPPTSLTGNGGE